MKESKKNVWTLVLTILKYAVAVVLGYAGGDSSVIDAIL